MSGLLRGDDGRSLARFSCRVMADDPRLRAEVVTALRVSQDIIWKHVVVRVCEAFGDTLRIAVLGEGFAVDADRL